MRGGIDLVGNIIGMICCLMCSLPFFILAAFGRNGDEPINFWSGDTTLKTKVRNVEEYNKQMAALYRKYAAAFVAAGFGCLFWPVMGMVMIGLNCTLGIYLVYRNYKKILRQHS